MTLPSFARAVAGGLELRVKVVPGASRSEIVGALGDRLKIRVSAPPERGRANRVVIELIREWLAAPDVEIVAGETRPEKSVRVRGVSSIPSLSPSRSGGEDE